MSRIKIRFVILLTLLFLAVTPHSVHGDPAKYDPEDGFHQYINWSNYARKEAESRYPEASAVNFLYVGCKAKPYTGKYYVYKFWMHSSEREFGVYVTLDVDHRNKKARVVKVEETDVFISSYGKWGKFASQATHKQFPEWNVKSYSPFGCTFMKENVAEQKFRLWLTNEDKNMIMQIIIHYNIDSEQVTGVKYKLIRSF
ncbi:DUF3889 domain-containing protein [Paenibacillus lupini]|uniref:DUF3889 domain-containing protein n=1 Tax=Paenibacillus lupini TaxID=1450204 RepID=UPI0014247047|nr:DUF3889 domain-containing protein [Paenibacillus lupini]NIK23673.1 hypothetical protein [Paenibacillus lupini]